MPCGCTAIKSAPEFLVVINYSVPVGIEIPAENVDPLRDVQPQIDPAIIVPVEFPANKYVVPVNVNIIDEAVVVCVEHLIHAVELVVEQDSVVNSAVAIPVVVEPAGIRVVGGGDA